MENQEITTENIKSRIKKMIDEEDKNEPLADDDIIQVLREKGVRISHRAVGKYRDQMQIAGSLERKTVV